METISKERIFRLLAVLRRQRTLSYARLTQTGAGGLALTGLISRRRYQDRRRSSHQQDPTHAVADAPAGCGPTCVGENFNPVHPRNPTIIARRCSFALHGADQTLTQLRGFRVAARSDLRRGLIPAAASAEVGNLVSTKSSFDNSAEGASAFRSEASGDLVARGRLAAKNRELPHNAPLRQIRRWPDGRQVPCEYFNSASDRRQ